MNSLKQNQKKPFIDDETLKRKKFQVAFSTVSEGIFGNDMFEPNAEWLYGLR
jgi:hypothetical protein